jgi:hypothetical protein
MSVYEEQKEHQSKYRDRRKQRIIDVMGGKCALCGYDRCNEALDLHHLNPDEKDFDVSARPCVSWEKTSAEIKKCILLCANCHREVHNGMVTKELHSSFNQDVCDRITAEVNAIKYGNCEQNRCCHCGKEVSNGSKLCPECYAKSIRRVNDRPTKSELAKLISEHGFLGTGKLFGVTDNAVRKWCKTDGLPVYRQEINDLVKSFKQ